MVRSLLTFFLITFLLALAVIGYYLFERYQQFQEQITIDTKEAQLVTENRTNTLSALLSAGVDSQQATRGFWYITSDASGNQSVAYFDLDTWSQRPLTPDEIQALAETVASSTVVDRDSMHEVSPQDLPPELQFHNQLYSGTLQPGQFAAEEAQLQKLYTSGKATSEQLWELSYMFDLQGDYTDRDAVNALNCKLFQQRCGNTLSVTLRGTVVDEKGDPIPGAAVSVLSHPEVKPVTTDSSGAYTIKLSILSLEKIRVSAVKRNYTDGVASAIALSSGKTSYSLDPIELTTPISIITIDTVKHTVSDPNDQANPDGSFVLHATSSTYQIPPHAIVHKDGTPYQGPVDVYIYEFTRETVPASLTTLDTFNDVLGYAGNLMQTLGMPYIQFFSPSGEQLDVFKSNPMLLSLKISGWQDERDNFYKRPEGPLTDVQVQELLAVSQGDPGFPITSQWLYDHQISTFAPFWVFDHLRGTWENQGMRLLDAQGDMQAPFYTTNGS